MQQILKLLKLLLPHARFIFVTGRKDAVADKVANASLSHSRNR
jgi:hypothetical protein